MEEKIPARYVSPHEGVLQQNGGPYKDGEGKPLQSLVLRRGDTVMVYPHEVLGYTVLKDPRNERDMEYLGIGRVVKDEHRERSDEELSLLGYEFHMPSPLWEDARPNIQLKEAPKKKSDERVELKQEGSEK